MKTKIENITPSLAKSYLLRNTHNRTFKPAMIAEFTREMRAGRWALTHQGIGFDEDGVLMDGQNRLAAIIESGATVPVQVSRDITKRVNENGISTMDVIDTGKNRSTADQLHLNHGIENANITAAAVRCIGMICYPSGFSGRLTVGQAKDILAIYEKEIKEVFERVQKFKPAKRAPVLGALAFCAKVCREPIYDLAYKIGTGDGLPRRSPALALRDHLSNKMVGGGLKKITVVTEWVGNIAFNHIEGAEIKQVKRGHNGLDFFRSKQRGNVDRVRQIGGSIG